MRLWSWNLAGAFNLRATVVDHLRASDADVVLAQEVRPYVAPSSGYSIVSPTDRQGVYPGDNSYFSAVLHRGDVAVTAEPLLVPLTDSRWDQLGASVRGTIAAATVNPADADPITVISVYCPWSGPGQPWQRGSGLVISDANAHRVVSDISMLAEVIDKPDRHRILAAGDWNILYGYGEGGSEYWADRYDTIFRRMDALGFVLCGPFAPDGGRQADPWPSELPEHSRCVPTFHSSKRSPAEAQRQLDFVFASKSISDAVKTRALNDAASWGPSDHCVIEIDLDTSRC